MKLNEIRPVIGGEYNLNEGVIPAHIALTLRQVITDGAVTNNVQNFVMAGLIGLFKDGGPPNWPRDLNGYPMSTSCETIEAVKSLSEEEAVEMANWLVTSLQRPAAFESNPHCHNCPSDTVEWCRWVLRKQD